LQKKETKSVSETRVSSNKETKESKGTKTDEISSAQISTGENAWRDDKTKLDDYQFRKSLTKKSEKVEINCEKADKEKVLITQKIEEMVKTEYSELIDFLEQIRMMKYFEVFQKNCIDDLGTILGIQVK
jgi:hypothetical protein